MWTVAVVGGDADKFLALWPVAYRWATARESVIGKLAELKKETKEHPRTPVVPKKHRETELE